MQKKCSNYSGLTDAEAGFRFHVTEGGFSDAAGKSFLHSFNGIFGENKPEKWLSWKYGAGKGFSYSLIDKQDNFVANWSAFPTNLEWNNKTISAVQNGDVFVDPRLRGILRKRGPLFYLSERFLRENMVLNKRYELAFGFPNDRHMRLLHKLGLFENLFEMRLVKWHRKKKIKQFGAFCRKIEKKPSIRWLKARCRSVHTSTAEFVAVQRNPEYLLWRYWAHPQHSYIFYKVQPSLFAEPTLAILRYIENNLYIIDLIGPISHVQTVIEILSSNLLPDESKCLNAWASPFAASVMPQPDGIGSTGAYFAYAVRSTPSPDVARLLKWWLLAGDTDFL